MKINHHANTVSLFGVDVPFNVFHVRRPDEDGGFLPKGGMTVAYVLRIRNEQVFLTAAVSVCSHEDHFVKRTGKTIAMSRLSNALQFDETKGLSLEIPLGEASLLPVDRQKLTPVNACFVYSFMESDLPVQEVVQTAVESFVYDYRTTTYEGSNVLEDLEEIDDGDFDFSDAPETEDDEDEDEDDSENDEDMTDLAAESSTQQNPSTSN